MLKPGRARLWVKPERVPTIEKQLSLIARGKVVAGNVPKKGKCTRTYPNWNPEMSTMAYAQSHWAYNFHASPEELKAFFIPLSDEPAPYYHEQEVTIEPNEDYVGGLV